MNAPLFEKVRNITADVLQVPASRLTPESSPENIESWDSVHHLNLILAFEQEFAIQFEPEEIDGMNTFGRILEILEGKVSSRA